MPYSLVASLGGPFHVGNNRIPIQIEISVHGSNLQRKSPANTKRPIADPIANRENGGASHVGKTGSDEQSLPRLWRKVFNPLEHLVSWSHPPQTSQFTLCTPYAERTNVTSSANDLNKGQNPLAFEIPSFARLPEASTVLR